MVKQEATNSDTDINSDDPDFEDAMISLMIWLRSMCSRSLATV